jgi:hypothetical protein
MTVAVSLRASGIARRRTEEERAKPPASEASTFGRVRESTTTAADQSAMREQGGQ